MSDIYLPGSSFPMRTCAKCGKAFIVMSPGEWRFKRNIQIKHKERQYMTKWFCSWSCFRSEEE